MLARSSCGASSPAVRDGTGSRCRAEEGARPGGVALLTADGAGTAPAVAVVDVRGKECGDSGGLAGEERGERAELVVGHRGPPWSWGQQAQQRRPSGSQRELAVTRLPHVAR